MYVNKFDDTDLVFYVRSESLPHPAYKEILESMQKTVLSLIKVREVFRKEVQLDYDFDFILEHVRSVFRVYLDRLLTEKYGADVCEEVMECLSFGVTRYPYRRPAKEHIVRTFIMKIGDGSYTIDERT